MCLKSSAVVAAPSKAAQPREWVLIRTGNFSLSYFGGEQPNLAPAARTTTCEVIIYCLKLLANSQPLQTHTHSHREGGLKDA